MRKDKNRKSEAVNLWVVSAVLSQQKINSLKIALALSNPDDEIESVRPLEAVLQAKELEKYLTATRDITSECTEVLTYLKVSLYFTKSDTLQKVLGFMFRKIVSQEKKTLDLKVAK